MSLLTPEDRAALRANAAARRQPMRSGGWKSDPAPVVKLFSWVGAATWLAPELASDGDTMFGLADRGLGCPHLGCFSPREIEVLPFGLAVERDLWFASDRAVALGRRRAPGRFGPSRASSAHPLGRARAARLRSRSASVARSGRRLTRGAVCRPSKPVPPILAEQRDRHSQGVTP